MNHSHTVKSIQPDMVQGRRTMRRDRAGHRSESLTNYQVNITRVPDRRIMKRKTAGPGSESLTACQANTIRVPYGRIMRGKQLNWAVNHSQPVQLI